MAEGDNGEGGVAIVGSGAGEIRDRGRTAGAPGGRVTRVVYDGTTADVLFIVLWNALLNLLTLGFYRFWGKTRLRRYFWGAVSFRGDRVEYAGRGIELLIGFLIVIVLLAGIFVGTELLLNALGADITDLGMVQAVQVFVFYFLFFVAIYRARRYRLTRTQWRGIRGGQTGSAIGYGILGLGWGLVNLITLGLAYPVMRTRLARYQMTNTWFGDQAFSFEGRARELFGRWILAWLLLLPSLGMTYVWYRVSEVRYFVSKSRFGPLAFASSLTTGRVIWIYLTNLFVIGALSVFFFAVVYVLLGGTAAFTAPGGTAESEATRFLAAGAENWGVIILFLLYLVVLGVLRMLVFIHPMIDALCNNLEVSGEMDFESLAQSSLAMPGRGEGLADALDVGSI